MQMMEDPKLPPNMEKVSWTLEQLTQLKSDVLSHAPYASRVSLGLLIRLVTMDDMIPVLREIDALEGLAPATAVKRSEGEQFKHPPLFPFWHKHFFAPRHMLRNIGERWNIARGQGNPALDAALSEIAKECGHDPDMWPGAVAHRIIIDGFSERANANRLTGDWIIFAKHDGQNITLTSRGTRRRRGRPSPPHL
jgi:hypothetical protein